MFVALFSFASTHIYAYDARQSSGETQKSYSAKGEVIAVDKGSSKVKLKHDAIPELKWPAMTMFFKVADKLLLDTVQVGDRVEFEFVKVNGSGPQITHIKTLK